MDDIANHVVKAFETIKDVQKPENHVCDEVIEPWQFGAQLQKAILEVNYQLSYYSKLKCF